MPRPLWSRHRASNASARLPRATGGSRSSKSWAGSPDTSRWGRLMGSRYHPASRISPEHRTDCGSRKHLYDLQKNVVIVCGEGIVDEHGCELGALSKSTDPAGNMASQRCSGGAASQADRDAWAIATFSSIAAGNSAKEAIFTRKVGHTQRGGRPILLRPVLCGVAGSKAVDLLVEGRNNAVSVLQYNADKGFHVEGYDANRFRDRWGLIHARQMHPASLRSAIDEAFPDGHRLSAADLHRRHRQR